ncbi:hypothetical protein M0802_016036 [Mischocyttarus mexicanus]|nr:hypothetical protein M0802_016036 [Mischocyttarus mexicanus]
MQRRQEQILKKTKQKINKIEIRVLRTILGLTLRDLQTNTSIRQRCNVENINKWIRTRKKGWNEHVDRMNPDRLADIYKNNTLYSRRPIGRSPKRWKDNRVDNNRD